ncbi:hypothetical protein [Streptococcus sp. DTU_2020_1000888_1_SI_GRL_NUU_041A]|uniref:hypothetical protein n=1 Tax=Streptococcus sp. DTU_2020_1000888_1_SI_GRL_NUU_041A TaxID=3077723 RepID=UPI0028EC6CEF|nr:hypothetical protein [Streptococcus sp. DTU_2020_1000888_1_SI_GRL_NUU_041A]WNU96055.1 hypothetical protein RSK81_12850 [Streptococcus sp. DTU_2020_1000888_1_SI_GRL_NUU_041A]
MIIYYIFFALNFIPWAIVIGGAIWWYVANKANNNLSMMKALKVIILALVFIYTIRFLALTVFSVLYNKDNVGAVDIKGFRDIFTVLQLLLLAFLPSFANTQSAIYNYQKMFTEGRKRDSAAKQRSSLIIGLVITVGGILILQFFKSIFVY